jgi:carbamoyltransferase|tara:strand:+ start:172 stop:2013 length:1842 start_codon:yes stop_codon:yes gene_type:complete
VVEYNEVKQYKEKSNYILGISAFYHDSSAAIIKDGKIIAAVQEERFSRTKFDSSYPKQSIDYCLQEAKINISDLSNIVYFENTHLKFDRILKTYFKFLPKSFSQFVKALELWLSEKIYIEKKISEHLGWNKKLISYNHHQSHAASAFYPSPFKESAILTLDGVGEWTCTSIGFGKDNKIESIKEIDYPNSLGMIYSAFTEFSGFKVNEDEYKLMGLSPYGNPKYVNKIKENLITIFNDGSYELNLKYFSFQYGVTTINKNFEELFGVKRKQHEDIRKLDEDLAASIQDIFNEIFIKLAKTAKKLTRSKNLVIAGGVGLNCVANGKIAKQRIFENIWVQAAPGDAGCSLGCALLAYYSNNHRQVGISDQKSSLLGPQYTNNEIKNILENYSIQYSQINNEKDLLNCISDYLIDNKIIGLFQGRMEFGPRALGARSIIGDPRSKQMQTNMNLKIKYRESFRPFAPAILEECLDEYFDIFEKSPFMSFVFKIKDNKRFNEVINTNSLIDRLHQSRSVVPAITHVDYSARIQTVSKENNPLFYRIIENFYKKTNCPMVINTSFNVMGEPIVCKPIDSLRCFFSNEMDILVLNNFVITKSNQKIESIGKITERYEQLK